MNQAPDPKRTPPAAREPLVARMEQWIAEKTGEPLPESPAAADCDEQTRLESAWAMLQDRYRRQADQLQAAREAADRSRADLQEFAYVASHDLQEPLRAIAGYCRLLEKKLGDQTDEDVQTFLQYAVDGARRMQVLVDCLLDFSRVESAGRPFEMVEMGALVDAACAARAADFAEFEGTVTVEDPLPEVSGDRNQLLQVWEILFDNAIKFRAPERPPVVRISVEPHSSGSHTTEWIFRCGDNGIGFEPRNAEKIFTIFQRLHGRDAYPGSGLGLALAKQILQRHGGRIWAESQPGQGATFFFALPR